MASRYNCPVCDRKLADGGGIGPYCPNRKCPVSDGADLYRGPRNRARREQARRDLRAGRAPKEEHMHRFIKTVKLEEVTECRCGVRQWTTLRDGQKEVTYVGPERDHTI